MKPVAASKYCANHRCCACTTIRGDSHDDQPTSPASHRAWRVHPCSPCLRCGLRRARGRAGGRRSHHAEQIGRRQGPGTHRSGGDRFAHSPYCGLGTDSPDSSQPCRPHEHGHGQHHRRPRGRAGTVRLDCAGRHHGFRLERRWLVPAQSARSWFQPHPDVGRWPSPCRFLFRFVGRRRRHHPPPAHRARGTGDRCQLGPVRCRRRFGRGQLHPPPQFLRRGSRRYACRNQQRWPKQRPHLGLGRAQLLRWSPERLWFVRARSERRGPRYRHPLARTGLGLPRPRLRPCQCPVRRRRRQRAGQRHPQPVTFPRRHPDARERHGSQRSSQHSQPTLPGRYSRLGQRAVHHQRTRPHLPVRPQRCGSSGQLRHHAQYGRPFALQQRRRRWSQHQHRIQPVQPSAALEERSLAGWFQLRHHRECTNLR